MRVFILFVFQFLIFNLQCFSQDLDYAHKIVNELTSKEYHGRGYVSDGDTKAAAFIKDEFTKLGLKPFDKDYYQSFSFPVNTFPSTMKIKLDGKELIAGTDYIVNPASSGSNQTFEIDYADSISFIQKVSLSNEKCVVLDNALYGKHQNQLTNIISQKKTGAIVLLEEKKLTWSVSQSHYDIPVITILKNKFPAKAKNISIHIAQKFVEQHQTQNVIGVINGSANTDTFFVLTAHYDHLGQMGKKTFFPGANDNASGTSMLLNLAKYFAMREHKPKYNLMFIAFAGEEAGLVGSKYYTEHPLFSLEKIKFLINLDLLGTGEEGIMVVNATEYKDAFEKLKLINTEKNYVVKIGERGKAKNSDHYYFTEKNVPAFFIYTLGGVSFYHDVLDRGETLPFTDFEDVFRLLRDFEESF
jgi:aminopeptidase YwaD